MAGTGDHRTVHRSDVDGDRIARATTGRAAHLQRAARTGRRQKREWGGPLLRPPRGPHPSRRQPDSLIVSARGGGSSKDTWVTSAVPALQQSTWLRQPRVATQAPRDSAADGPLPGRVAAQLFVLGRAGEHAELVIRLIRTVLSRLDQPLGVGTDGGAESLQVLLAALGSVSGFDSVTEPEVTDIVGSSLTGPRDTGMDTGMNRDGLRDDLRRPHRSPGAHPAPRRPGGREPGRD